MFLVGYYLVTAVNAMTDGLSMILLVDVMLSGGFLSTPSVHKMLGNISLSWNTNTLFVVILLLFFVKAVITYVVTILDGYMEARLRQLIQESGLRAILAGDWEYLRDIRVGQRVGAITEEATRASQFVAAIIRTIYGFIAAIILCSMAIMVNVQVSIILFFVGFPILLLLRYFFAVQGKIADELVIQRQGFFASITERLTGLFQIKVGEDISKHVVHALGYQYELTRLEIRYWKFRACVSGLNALMPALILFIFYIWSFLRHQELHELLYYIAGVGVLGMKAINYVNIATANVGNLTAFSGSITPVHDLFLIPKEKSKLPISEKIIAVAAYNISYSYNANKVIDNISLEAKIGQPLLISGPSGSGKTTLANIIAGVYSPQNGKVIYHDASGKSYNSEHYKTRIGYVTQDIHLFHGSIKDNLVFSDMEIENNFVRECLKKAGADDFIKEIGGIEATIAEAGRSLSGGEKRRLGIARVLTRTPDILVLDEVTAGLDHRKKSELIKTIKELAKDFVIIIIAHDINIADLETDNICNVGI